MTHSQLAHLPDVHELLLLRANRPPSVLCCFAALARRSRNTASGIGDREFWKDSNVELSFINSQDPLPQIATPSATETVHVYEPQSARLPGGMRRGRSTDTLPSAAATFLRAPPMGPRSLSATLPDVRQECRQQPLLQQPGSLLRRRGAAGSGDVVANRLSLTNFDDSKRMLVRQVNVWSDGDGDELDGVDSGNRRSLGSHGSGDLGISCPTEEASSGLSDPGCGDQGKALNSSVDHGVETLKVDLFNGQIEPPVSNFASSRADGSRDSDIVELYLDSILESLSEIEDALVAAEPTAPVGADYDADINIDELLLRLEEPIGESTECDVAPDASEAELARGRHSGEDDCGPATATETTTTTATADAEAEAEAAGDTANDTGSELVNDEFHFLRTRTLPPPPPPPAPTSLPSGPALPPRQTAETLPGNFAGIAEQFLLPSNKEAAADGRIRLRKRHQSYAMGGMPQRALSDWDGGAGAVLLSARAPRATLPTSPAPPPPPSQSLSLPRQATLQGVPPLLLPRAVVFHPPSLAGRAHFLVNYLASGGQPACRWSQLPSSGGARFRRSSTAFGRRFAERICGRGADGRHWLPELRAAFGQCAGDGYLPILLLPPAMKLRGDSNNNNNNHGDKFCRQLRSALADLQPTGLAGGLVVVTAGRSDAADVASWSAAAGEATPTLVLSGPAGTAPEAPGLDCCRAVLAAARQCAAIAALHRLVQS